MSILIIPIIIFIAIVVIGVLAARSSAHGPLLRFNEEQVKQLCSEYGYGCFEMFEVYFNGIEWERSYKYPKSLFGVGYFQCASPSKIHAGIIQFDGKGMIIKGKDKKMAERLIKNKLKEIPLPKDLKNTVDWGCK